MPLSFQEVKKVLLEPESQVCLILRVPRGDRG